MGISILNPASAASAAGPDAKTFTITEAYATYDVVANFSAGGYTIATSPTDKQVKVQFFNATSELSDTNTSSGTATIILASDATGVLLTDLSATTSTIVTLTQVSGLATGAEIAGTLDTLTTSGTYNQTGQLLILTVGGGGGGGGGNDINSSFADSGRGGAAGGLSLDLIYANTSTSYTIGNGGTAGLGGGNVNNSGNSGGATTFGNVNNLTANGGAAGSSGNNRGDRTTGGTGTWSSGGQGGKGGWGNGGADDISGNASAGPSSFF